MKDLTFLRTLRLNGMPLGVEKFAEPAQGEHDPLRLAVGGSAVPYTTAAHYLVHRASEQHSEAERELRTRRNHPIRRGMLAALRRAPAQVKALNEDQLASRENAPLSLDGVGPHAQMHGFAIPSWRDHNFISPSTTSRRVDDDPAGARE